MKIAVTGATGHVGGLIVRELHARQHTIKALVRGAEAIGTDSIPIEWIKGDLSDLQALTQLMESCEVLIHAAALISIEGGMNGLVHNTNVEGTRCVMEAAKDAGIKRVIYISSIHAYRQEPIDVEMDEQRELADSKTFAYNRSKKEGQEISLSYASPEMEVLALNPTSVIGPYDYKPSKLGQAIINMVSGRLPFVIKGGYDFCDGRDVANAAVNALSMGRSGEAYLLSGKWHSFSEFTALLSSVSGKRINPLELYPLLGWIGLPFIKLTGWLTKKPPLYTKEALITILNGNRHISNDKARTELNYNPKALEETLRDTYVWFSKNGYLD